MNIDEKMIYSCEAFYNRDKYEKRGGISITLDDKKGNLTSQQLYYFYELLLSKKQTKLLFFFFVEMNVE